MIVKKDKQAPVPETVIDAGLHGYGVLALIGARHRAEQSGDSVLAENANNRFVEITKVKWLPKVTHHDPECPWAA